MVRKLLVDCDKNIKKRQSYLIILNQSIKILILFILFECKNDKELSKWVIKVKIFDYDDIFEMNLKLWMSNMMEYMRIL